MRVSFRPEARREALEARTWYENRSPGLGLEFARALDTAVETVLRMPMVFPEVEGSCRRVFMRRFPYAVIYRPDSAGIVVMAVFHCRRDPTVWLGRVDND